MKSRLEQFLVALGERISRLREEKGYSQRLMASNLDNDERHLRRIEKGETNPTTTLLLDTADYLEIGLAELLLL